MSIEVKSSLCRWGMDMGHCSLCHDSLSKTSWTHECNYRGHEECFRKFFAALKDKGVQPSCPRCNSLLEELPDPKVTAVWDAIILKKPADLIQSLLSAHEFKMGELDCVLQYAGTKGLETEAKLLIATGKISKETLGWLDQPQHV
jgi:hypothetical protein